jgi:hypothetical protein
MCYLDRDTLALFVIAHIRLLTCRVSRPYAALRLRSALTAEK